MMASGTSSPVTAISLRQRTAESWRYGEPDKQHTKDGRCLGDARTALLPRPGDARSLCGHLCPTRAFVCHVVCACAMCVCVCHRVADDLLGPWRLHPLSPVRSGVQGSRMAGRPVVADGKLYRFGQDCTYTYGHKVRHATHTHTHTHTHTRREQTRRLFVCCPDALQR